MVKVRMVKGMAVLVTAALMLASALSPAHASRQWKAPLAGRGVSGAPVHLMPAGDVNGGGG